jgi:hypothetical protein
MVVSEGQSNKRLRRLPNFQNQLRDYLHGKNAVTALFDAEAEVIAIIKSWGVFMLVC